FRSIVELIHHASFVKRDASWIFVEQFAVGTHIDLAHVNPTRWSSGFITERRPTVHLHRDVDIHLAAEFHDRQSIGRELFDQSHWDIEGPPCFDFSELVQRTNVECGSKRSSLSAYLSGIKTKLHCGMNTGKPCFVCVLKTKKAFES